MADDNEAPQIVADDSPIPDQIWSASRAAVLALTAFAFGRGWIAGDLATLIGALFGIIAPVVMSQLKTRHRSVQLANIAGDDRVPNSVAVLKSQLPS